MRKSRQRKRLNRSLRSESLEPRMMLSVAHMPDFNPNHNYVNAADINRDGYVTPRDALITIEYLDRFGSNAGGNGEFGTLAYDANNDGEVTPADTMAVIHRLTGESESHPLIQFFYTVTDPFGAPIANNRVKAGEDFRLNLFAQDLRPGSQKQGVFSGYADIVYDDAAPFSLVYGEKQQISLENCLCDGTFTLTFQGATTAPINGGQGADAVAADIQAALEGLPSVNKGDVEVRRPFGENTKWNVRFIGKFQKADVPPMQIDVSQLAPADPNNPVNGTVTEIEPADISNSDTFNSSFPPGPKFLTTRIASQGDKKYEDVGSFFQEISPPSNPGDAVLLNYALLHADERGQVRFTAGRPDNPRADVLLFGIPDDLLDQPPHNIDYSAADVTVIIERPVNAVDDAFPASGETILEDSSAIPLDVLANDFLEDGSTGTLALDPTGLGTPDQGGTVTVSNGVVLYTPAADFFGVETFTYTAVDGLGNSDVATVTVTVTNVNDPPVAVDDDRTVQEDSVDNSLMPLTNDIVGPANEGETLSIVSVTAGSHPEDFASRVTIAGNGTDILYTPLPDFFGIETFEYEVTDGNGLNDTATISVTVENVNDPPTANDDTATVLEDSVGNMLNVLANDTITPDVGETLAITSLSPVNVQPDFATRVVNQGTHIEYTPPADFFGSEVFDYTISDGNGGESTARVDVTVENVNDPPMAVDDPGLFAFEFLPNPQTLDVLANDTSLPDDPNEPLVIVDVQPVAGQFDSASTIAISADGKTLEYIPNPNREATFTDVFTYTIEDPEGAQDTATGTVEVLPLTRPKARDDNFTVDEDSVDNVLNVTTSNTGRDFFNDSAQNRTLAIITQPTHGTATVSGLDILYTPDPDFFGTDTLVYEIDDDFVDPEDGPSQPDQATVTITVNNVNDPPVARDDVATVDEDSSNNFVDVLANDDDGPDEGETLIVTSATGGAGFQGTVTVAPGGTGVRYTPAPDFFGMESFTYEISDQNGGVATATVSVTVNNLNDDPTANDDTFDVDEDTTNSLDVLANDSIAPDEGETLTITDAGFGGTAGATQRGGVVSIIGGTQVEYTPPQDYFGTDTFLYSISDGNGGSSTATVTVNVANVNDDPDAIDDQLLALKNFVDQELDVLANDTDAPDVGETLTITDVGVPNNGGSVSIVDGRVLRYTPATDFEGFETFTYTISDGNGGADVATVTVEVVDAIPSDVSGFLYIDADNDGEFDEAEPFQDLNNNGRWEANEPFDDLNGNGFRNSSELRLGGIDVMIQGRTIKGDIYTETLTTGPDGVFVFQDVLPSSMEPGDPGYTLHAEQAMFLLDGKDTIGDQGGTTDSASDALRNIRLDIFGTNNAQNNRFGERGVKSDFLNPAELFASSSPFGALVASDTTDHQYWFALMEGWEDVQRVSVTDIVAPDASHPERVHSAKVTVQFRNGSSAERTIVPGTPQWSHFRVMGYDQSGGYVFRLDGTLADLGLTGGGEAEGEYVSAVDELFAGLGAAE